MHKQIKTHYEPHPAAELFPMISEAQFAELKEDIKQHGLRERLRVFDGLLLDGRNRQKALLELGKDPADYATEIKECHDPIAYVISLNGHRRHLDVGQRAMIAAKAKALYENEALDRKRIYAKKLKNTEKNEDRDNCPYPERGRSRDKAGEAMGVSGKAVDRAVVVIANGSEELQAMVTAGDISLNKAHSIASEIPKSQQAEAAKESNQRKKKEKDKSVDTSWPAMLKWASQRKFVTKDQLAEHFDVIEPDCRKRLAIASQTTANGYMVIEQGDGKYHVAKAAMLPIDKDQLCDNWRDICKELNQLADEAQKALASSTSVGWVPKSQREFVNKVFAFTKEFIRR